MLSSVKHKTEPPCLIPTRLSISSNAYHPRCFLSSLSQARTEKGAFRPKADGEILLLSCHGSRDPPRENHTCQAKEKRSRGWWTLSPLVNTANSMKVQGCSRRGSLLFCVQ